mmetsp:Transcript_16719/g.54460  ORF Transcript_16719/g.54460 Transcript_16719/m.54460 type:complete len:257 (-) Transcript_16719:1605-2375(-)
MYRPTRLQRLKHVHVQEGAPLLPLRATTHRRSPATQLGLPGSPYPPSRPLAPLSCCCYCCGVERPLVFHRCNIVSLARAAEPHSDENGPGGRCRGRSLAPAAFDLLYADCRLLARDEHGLPELAPQEVEGLRVLGHVVGVVGHHDVLVVGGGGGQGVVVRAGQQDPAVDQRELVVHVPRGSTGQPGLAGRGVLLPDLEVRVDDGGDAGLGQLEDEGAVGEGSDVVSDQPNGDTAGVYLQNRIGHAAVRQCEDAHVE